MIQRDTRYRYHLFVILPSAKKGQLRMFATYLLNHTCSFSDKRY